MSKFPIIFDEWSLLPLCEEITASYDAICSGRLLSLPELPIQYAEISYWQRNQLKGEALELCFSRWRKQLLGATPLLESLADIRHPIKAKVRTGKHAMGLPNDLARELKR